MPQLSISIGLDTSRFRVAARETEGNVKKLSEQLELLQMSTTEIDPKKISELAKNARLSGKSVRKIGRGDRGMYITAQMEHSAGPMWRLWPRRQAVVPPGRTLTRTAWTLR